MRNELLLCQIEPYESLTILEQIVQGKSCIIYRADCNTHEEWGCVVYKEFNINASDTGYVTYNDLG